MTIREFRPLLRGVRGSDTKFTAQCPAHNDRQNSLSVSLSKDYERILIHCFRGCDTEQILSSMGLRLSDLFTTARSKPNNAELQRAKADMKLVEDFENHYAELHGFLADYCRIYEKKYGDFKSNDFLYLDYLFDEMLQARTFTDKVKVFKTARKKIAGLLTQSGFEWGEFFSFE